MVAQHLSVRGIARLLLATALSPAPWRAMLFLALSFALGLAAFVGLVTAVTLGVGTLIIWIGVPILVVTMMAWRWAARLERARIGLLAGVVIATPYRTPVEGGFLHRLRTQAADPATWRDLLYLFLLFPVGIAELVVLAAGLGFALGLLATPLPGTGNGVRLFGPHTPHAFPASLVLGLLGIPALILVANLFVGVVWLHARGAQLLLGTSRGDRLRERVSELSDSRSRAVSSALDERRQFERDVHDGAQQRLVALALDLGMAREKMEQDPDAARGLVEEAHEEAKRALAELRDLVRGVHPSVLTDRGLDAAVSALAARSPVPVSVRVDVPDRPPPAVESAAYFVVAESLANIADRSGADHAQVEIERRGDTLSVEIADDGRGGAAESRGTGLQGLRDRVEAIGGTFGVESPEGGGTRICAALPAGGQPAP
jgi:signal transduction histidine kinase